MKKRVMTFVAACLALSVCAQKNGHTGYPITPVPFTAVKVNDAFWGQRLKASREVTIPLAFSKCEETGRYKNFEMAANPGPHNKVTGFSFDDTDVYKTIEGASYLLQTYPDEKFEKIYRQCAGNRCQGTGTGRIPVYFPDDESGTPP